MNDIKMSTKNTEPLISVALPVLNGGSLLEMSVLSVVNQTWKNWELLILDDGSTDGAIDSILSISDYRIKVVSDGDNRGLSARLNQALLMAKGRYFARMDHDDICHPDRLMHQVLFLENHPEIDLLATQCITINEQEEITGILPAATEHDAICLHPWKGFYMPHPTWMGRTEWFRLYSYREPAPYCCEDQDLLLRAHLSSRYHTLAERLLAYRVRSHTPMAKLLRTRISMFQMQFEYFQSKKQWLKIGLSFTITISRICYDLWHELQHFLLGAVKKRRRTITSVTEYDYWNKLIKKLKLKN